MVGLDVYDYVDYLVCDDGKRALMIGNPRRIVAKASKRLKLARKPKKAQKTKLPSMKTAKSGGQKKPLSISRLIALCDKEFSIFVRELGSRNGENECFTCGRWYPIKKLHCGHYLSRYYKVARWNMDNARPQCMMCNMWKRGDPIVFRRNLIAEIGEARVLAVEKLRDAPIKLSREFLTNLLTSLTT